VIPPKEMIPRKLLKKSQRHQNFKRTKRNQWTNNSLNLKMFEELITMKNLSKYLKSSPKSTRVKKKNARYALKSWWNHVCSLASITSAFNASNGLSRINQNVPFAGLYLDHPSRWLLTSSFKNICNLNSRKSTRSTNCISSG